MNPADDPAPYAYELLTEAERFALELRWYEGSLLPDVEWLLAFAARHRLEIHSAAQGSHEPAVLIAALKRLIAELGSVHIRAELQAQQREIENELWYRGEKGDYDRRRIEEEWTAAYAAAWRRWRICEYLFTAERCAPRIIAVLLDQAKAKPE